MNAEAKDVTTKLSDELTSILQPEIEKVLPQHVGLDRFMRVVLTAISMNPALRDADRRSLFTSCVKAATDGLVPDGREAALVIFGGKAQYMPMVAGIIKKVRQSGELKSISSNVVYERDQFRYWIDDDGEHVLHEPKVAGGEDRGKLVAVYAIAKTTAGGVYTEVMSRGQIDQVRNVSRAKDSGPWASWYDEMARKTVIRRLSKRLPMSTDLETVVRRDDELYDLDSPQAIEAAKSGTSAAKRALGLLSRDVEAPPQEQEGKPAAGRIPQYDEDTAVKAIRGCKTVKQLDNLAEEIRDDFVGTQREVPVRVTAAIDDRREALAQ